MKVWLNNLKEGDIFYYIIFNDVFKCKNLGDAHNINFRMSRIKFEILDISEKLKELFGNINETFVNQYVYDNYDEAEEELIKRLKEDLSDKEFKVLKLQDEIGTLQSDIKLIRKRIDKYDAAKSKKIE